MAPPRPTLANSSPTNFYVQAKSCHATKVQSREFCSPESGYGNKKFLVGFCQSQDSDGAWKFGQAVGPRRVDLATWKFARPLNQGVWEAFAFVLCNFGVNVPIHFNARIPSFDSLRGHSLNFGVIIRQIYFVRFPIPATTRIAPRTKIVCAWLKQRKFFFRLITC